MTSGAEPMPRERRGARCFGRAERAQNEQLAAGGRVGCCRAESDAALVDDVLLTGAQDEDDGGVDGEDVWA